MKTTENRINLFIMTISIYSFVIVVPIMGLIKNQSSTMQRTMTEKTDTTQHQQTNPTKIPPKTEFPRSETELTKKKFVQPTAPNQTLRERMYNALRSAFFEW